MPPEERARARAEIAALPIEQRAALAWSWDFAARDSQRLPPGDWLYWLLKCGRGFGKTRTGAETVRQWIAAGFRYVNLIGATADDARDVMVSGESGILAVCPPWERPQYKPSQRKLVWPNGAESLIFTADEPDRLRGKQHDKLWCFCAGTRISTPDGDAPIEALRVGDWVQTRFGARQVVATASHVDRVGTVRFSTGAELTGTREHPVLTSYGWTRLDSLSIGQSVVTATSAPTSASAGNTASAATSTSTGGSGSARTAPFLPARRSTTGTATRSTTRSRIWNALRTSSIARFTALLAAGVSGHRSRKSIRIRALDAAQLSCWLENSQQPSVSDATSGSPTRSARPSASAGSAGRSSDRSAATIAASVASIWEPAGRATVYNLAVESEHEYIANGVVVHNCDELAAWRYSESWDQAKFGLRLGRNPQAVITTTPRPTALVKEIMADPRTVVTHGSSLENRANLAEAFIGAILKKYQGTRLGRQEIDGEVLEDNPGALWKRGDIDRTRVIAAPELRRIVVAIDPAAKSVEGSDDTGIVVAGVADVENLTHGFVLDDATMQLAKPAAWAAQAVKLYHDRKADRIVAEGNNGGEMVESVIHAQDDGVPVTIVTATRGKEIRAEPVSALYEQGRVHHVGNFPLLEDELCEWDPQDATAASPNRLDALVWAITALMLDNDGTGILDYYRRQANRAKQTQADAERAR